jgi:hypothetical protein
MFAKVRLQNDNIRGSCARVWLDDVEISHAVQRIEIDAHADDVNRAIITLMVDHLDVEVQAEVRAIVKPFEDEVKVHTGTVPESHTHSSACKFP